MFMIEEYSINALPALQTFLYDGWVIRLSNGYTKRANSINPIYDSKINIDKKINQCETIFFENNIGAVIYKILDCEKYNTLDSMLETLGYEKVDIASVQVLVNYIPSNEINHNIIIANTFSEEWIDLFLNCSGNNKYYKETISKMLNNILGQKIVIMLKDANQFVGCGYGAIENDFVGIFDIVIHPDYRGKGFGTEIVTSILNHAAKNGITKSYLQLICGNSIAEKLYKKLGYTECYKYWYRRKIF